MARRAIKNGKGGNGANSGKDGNGANDGTQGGVYGGTTMAMVTTVAKLWTIDDSIADNGHGDNSVGIMAQVRQVSRRISLEFNIHIDLYTIKQSYCWNVIIFLLIHIRMYISYIRIIQL